MPIGRLLTVLAEQAPDKVAVTCGERSLTRAQLDERGNRLARAYEELGVTEGDFVTIALPNGLEFVESAVAVWKLGGVVQPVSHRLPHRERAAIVELADSKLVVGAEPGSHGDRTCVAEGYEAPAHLSGSPIEPDRVSPAWKATTSGGSTGTPKLIVSGESGRIYPAAITGMHATAESTVLVPGPLYHNAPFQTLFCSLFYGIHAVLLPSFDAEAALVAIDTHKVDVVTLVPTMMSRMLRVVQQQPGRFDLSSMRALWHMAAPCPPWVKEAWMDLVGPEHVFEMYGGTEAQVATTIDGVEWLAHRGSVGRPLMGSLRILDEDGNEVPTGEIGEVFMMGKPGSRPTYTYVGAKARSRDGWESIGDMGWVDEDGYLYLADRRTDLILSGGANIYPAEVESALAEHPAVECAVVVGLPDDDLGQRVHAVVQVLSDEVTGEELVAFLSERLVRYKVPRSMRLVDHALRDDAGKVRRSAVREEETQRMGSLPSPQSRTSVSSR